MQGAAEHYYCFLPTSREQLIPNTTANHAIINKSDMFFLSHVIARTICKVYVNRLGVLQLFTEQGIKQVFLLVSITCYCVSIG